MIQQGRGQGGVTAPAGVRVCPAPWPSSTSPPGTAPAGQQVPWALMLSHPCPKLLGPSWCAEGSWFRAALRGWAVLVPLQAWQLAVPVLRCVREQKGKNLFGVDL